MRYKKRPCPGCDAVEQRRAQTLCRNCIRQLNLGKKREREMENFKVTGERGPVEIGERFIYGTGAFLSFLAISASDLLHALVRLGSLEDAHGSGGGGYEKARHIYFKYSIPYSTRPAQYVWATHRQIEDIQTVLNFIEIVIEKAYEDGQRDGRSLILHLATAGVKELNQITMQK